MNQAIEENEAPSKPGPKARFVDTLIVRITPKQKRMLLRIQRVNRLDSLSQALRFALNEMV